MPFSYGVSETGDIPSSSSSELPQFAMDSILSLPEFVMGFAGEQEDLELSRDSLVNMFNTLEKAELIELLAMSVMESKAVRLSVGYTLSTMTTFRRLLVRNISFNSTTEEVKDLLQSRYGLVEEGSVVYDRATGKSKGFAFMTFASVESASNAILDSNNGLLELKGRPILLKFAADRCDAINANTRLVSDVTESSSHSSTTIVGCNTSSGVVSGRRLFVSALAPETTNDSLAVGFSPYGEMEECFVVSHPNGISRRFGFVTFVSENSAWSCLQGPVCIDGAVVSVQPAAERNGSSTAATTPLTGRQQRQALSPMKHQPAAPVVDDLVTNLLSQLNDESVLSSLLSSYQ